MADVTFNSIFITDWENYAAINKVYAEYFRGDKPVQADIFNIDDADARRLRGFGAYAGKSNSVQASGANTKSACICVICSYLR